ncbi:MAG: hypothetical protein AAGK97_07730 [Bacteroidota bacterium]
MLIFPISSQAQTILGIATKWADEFREWDVFTYDYETEEEAEGEIIMRWQTQNDWTEWDFRMFDGNGSIKQKFKDDPSIWELRFYEDLVTARTLWKNDFSEWRITDGNVTLKLKSRWRNSFNEWQIEDTSNGNFYIYTTWEDDPREWEIKDELSEDISASVKMMITFLVIYHSTPKI